jgi:predicted phosphodiesterase
MRALVLSDIHGNLEALDAVLAAADGLYDELWNLGDMVGYGASPNQVIDRIRPLSDIVVRGNHDRVCCGLTSPSGFNPVARQAALWTREELSRSNLNWLQQAPRGPVCPMLPGVTCVHGSPLDEDQYILSMRDAWAPLQQMDCAHGTGISMTFFGHTHVQGGFAQRAEDWQELRPHYPVVAAEPAHEPEARQQVFAGAGVGTPAKKRFSLRLPTVARPALRAEAQSHRLPITAGTRYLINPGSVGQPRDYDWRAAFAIYDSVAGSIVFHRVPYDLASSQDRILRAKLPERLAARLREGR